MVSGKNQAQVQQQNCNVLADFSRHRAQLCARWWEKTRRRFNSKIKRVVWIFPDTVCYYAHGIGKKPDISSTAKSNMLPGFIPTQCVTMRTALEGI
jgi:hypothetical protein